MNTEALCGGRKGEGVTSTATALSHILQELDRASVQLDNIDRAVQKGDLSTADVVLKRYVRALTNSREELEPVRISWQQQGLIGAVLDRLESQLSRLEQMKGNVRAGHSASVEEPLAQVKAALRLLQSKVIEGPG